MTAGRSYLFVAGVPWSRFLETRVGATARFGRLYRLDAGALQPVVNVFVRSGTGANGAPRATIEARNRVVSAAGVNWIGSRFAEVYVTTDPAAQGRDWSRSVLAVVCANLLETGKIPLLYQPTDGQDNELAEAAARVGFTDTGSMGMEITGIYHGG